MNKSILILILIAFSLGAQIVLPNGWIKPQNKYFKEEWRNIDYSKYLAQGLDIDNNGLKDSVFILEGKSNSKFGVWLFLQKSKNKFNTINLYSSETDTLGVRLMKEHIDTFFVIRLMSIYGIEIVKPGLYKTACGKGYWECGGEGNDLYEILLKFPGISFFHFDAGGTKYYYWDTIKNKIKYNIMDD